MPAALEAGSGDGVDARFLQRDRFLRCGGGPDGDDALVRHSSRISFGGIPKMKLKTGTFASSTALGLPVEGDGRVRLVCRPGCAECVEVGGQRGERSG